MGVKANLPDLLAALLPPQIEAVDKTLERREEVARRYELALGGDERLRFQATVSGAKHARHLFPVCVDPMIRDRMLLGLSSAGVGCTVNYRSVPTLTYYREKYGYGPGDFPVSHSWGEGTISLPLYVGLEPAAQDHVIETVRRELDRLTRDAA